MLIGNFLAEHKATIGISQKLIIKYKNEYGISIPHASTKKNKIERAFDIIYQLIKIRPSKAIVDTYSNIAFNIAVITTLVSYILRFKLVLVVRGGKFPDFYTKYKSFVRFILNQAVEIRTPSLYVKQFLEKESYNVIYSPNPLFLENFQYTDKRPQQNAILWIRGFNNIYNPKLAVDILKEVKKTIPQAILTMIGPDGGELSNTLNYIKELGLEKDIHILGPIPNNSLYQYMHTHDVFINTTMYESFGMAVVEAASAGIPIVSTSVGELPYIWKHGEDMFLSSQIDAEEMAKYVVELLTNTSLAEYIRSNARKKAESFSWDHIKKDWEQLLELNSLNAGITR